MSGSSKKQTRPTNIDATVAYHGDYGMEYEGPVRWLNYGAQIRAVMQCTAKTMLEIGVGSGTVTSILRSRGIAVTTFDIDPELKPDVLGSVHELDRHVAPKSFDLVLCSEVLEHLPFEIFADCCSKLAAAAREYVLIGLPCFPRPRWGVTMQLRIPKIGTRKFTLGISPLPQWYVTGGGHCWTIDYKPYTAGVVYAEAEKSLKIEQVIPAPRDPSHLMLKCLPKE